MKNIYLIILTTFLALVSNAQINYTDIIPDIVLNTSDTSFIDIDGDGIDDLKFTQEDSIIPLNANGIGVTLLHYDIEFIGDNPSYDPGHLYPFKVDSNNVIDTNSDNRQWVTKFGGNDVIRVMHIHFFGGADIGEWASFLSNSYLGFRIKIGTKWHYGWVRVAAANTDASELIIKDYAYNEEAEEMIRAGQIKNFGPSALAISYEDSLCGLVVGFVRRNTAPTFLYNIVYKKMSWGTFDSISIVPASDPSYYLDTDPLISLKANEYRISTVDSINGESLLSDTAICSFLSTDSSISGNIRINYHHFEGAELKNYSLFYRLDSIYQPIAFDSITTQDTTLVDTLYKWAYGCYNYMAHCVLKKPITIAGYGIMDTLRSNPASNYPLNIFNPIADFNAIIPVGAAFSMMVSFEDKSKAAITRWTWIFGDGDSSHVRNPSHTYLLPGVYDVTLMVANCYGMDVIEKKGLISVGINTSVTEINCKLYPNPTKAYFTIELASNQQINYIKVIDFMGKEILWEKNIHQSKYTMDLSHSASGIYFIEIATQSQVFFRKLLLE